MGLHNKRLMSIKEHKTSAKLQKQKARLSFLKRVSL